MTMMRNFDTELDTLGVSRIVVVDRKVRPVRPPVDPREDLLCDGPWDWRVLRDYVEHEIAQRNGPSGGDGLRELGIFKGFINRWGPERAKKIAQAAFDLYDGRWGGAPITVTRFCKGNDPYFAVVIAERLGLS